ncbi:MAG: 1,4-alpha-glucan-branching enzyme, partial [Bacteroidales bacterium]|nr:1,4-alpha-glucan-branching enzyme [Bacteroidales bacterium]
MIYDDDSWLEPYKAVIDARHQRILEARRAIAGDSTLYDRMNNHQWYGLHHDPVAGTWTFREWAPNASRIFLIGDFNNWRRSDGYALKPVGGGDWEIVLDDMFLNHGMLYKLYVEWPGGGGERLPAYVRRTVQDPVTKTFSAQVWAPDKQYEWKNPRP